MYGDYAVSPVRAIAILILVIGFMIIGVSVMMVFYIRNPFLEHDKYLLSAMGIVAGILIVLFSITIYLIVGEDTEENNISLLTRIQLLCIHSVYTLDRLYTGCIHPTVKMKL